MSDESAESNDPNTCLFCKSTFSVPFGLEPTELCNMCAQELSARVLDACVTSWVPTQGKTPKELLHALMMWEQQIALDPAVSEVAAEWKRRADLGDAAMALRDQEVALSGRLRDEKERAQQKCWALKRDAAELLSALAVHGTQKAGDPVDIAAKKLNNEVVTVGNT